VSATHESFPADNLAFSYIQQLLEEQGRPLAVDEIAELLQFPAGAARRIMNNAHRNGRLNLADGGYTLPQGRAR
jgi:hypothetical protein